MSKAGRRILSSVRKARPSHAARRGKGFIVHVPDEVNMRAIRKRLALTRVFGKFRPR